MKRFRRSGRVRFAAVAVIAGGSACLAGVGYAAGLVHLKHSSATSAQYPPSRVTICHHTHSQHNPFVTITVSEHALPAHLRHGDTVGACSEQQGSAQTQTAKPKKEKPAHQSHGKSDAAHARKAEKASRTDAKAGKRNHGKSLAHGKSGLRGKGHGQKGHANGHAQGKGKGHDKNKSHGNGQGQGHGQGHGPGGHGNSGGVKGNGHKP
jgi:hypothetical protein